MRYTNVTTAIALTSLLGACASPTDSNDRMPDKADSSPALQIVSAAGGEDKFRDRVVPKEALRNVSTSGYVSQTLLGMVFTTGLQGFLTAFISDNKNSWDQRNYITFVDAEKFQNASSKELRHYVIQQNIESHPTINQEYANSVSKVHIEQSNPVTKDIGPYTVVGFNVYEKSNSLACYDFKSERCYIGHFVQLRGRSLPIDSSLFSDEIRRQLPADKVIAIRYIYGNSYEYMVHNSKKNAFITDFSIYPSSPEWKLPKHTFMNMPETYRVTNFDEFFDNKEIRYVPMVRNNDTAYYFIEPVNGESVKSDLSTYHQRYEKIVDTKVSEIAE